MAMSAGEVQDQLSVEKDEPAIGRTGSSSLLDLLNCSLERIVRAHGID